MSQEIFKIPENAPQVGAIHVHYKNLDKEYQVTGISLNSDSDEWHVEYIPLYEGAVAQKFNRSLVTWLDPVIIDGKEITRYSFMRMG